MPIGGLDRGDRSADAAARRLLPKARKSTVFTPPPAIALGEPDYAIACDLAERITGKRISRQAHALSPKILDVDASWRRDPDRIFEIHPELAFQAMSGAPLTHAKKTREGLAERAGILRATSMGLPENRAIAGAARDDVLDAAAVAWSANRVATGVARCAPDPPERDDEDRTIAIWY